MIEQTVQRLVRVVGQRNVLSSPEDLYPYSMDASLQYRAIPSLVVRPCTPEEVVEIVTLANKEKIPVVARGGGTNFVGGVVPVRSGIVLDLTRMNKILEIKRTDLRCDVEPGVVHGDLEKELGKSGLFWPPDPGSSESCTIGGVLSTNAGGMRALKYGTARDWVLGLQVVLPTGEMIRTGARTLKSNVGYDLTRLIVGSEGTLGVITEACLKVRPAPETTSRLSAFFNEIEKAGAAVAKIFESGVTPVIVELMDRNVIRAANEWLHLGLPDAEASMLIDLDGTKEEVENTAKKVEHILTEAGATDVQRAASKEEMEQLYLIRREGQIALPRLTGKMTMPHDFCVPLSKLPEALRKVQELAEKWKMPVAILSHAGDGNVHPIFSVDVTDSSEMKRARELNKEICMMALDLGGTVSGEHGIGIDKAELMEHECGENSLRVMRSIKRAFDPNNIMNPGKMAV
jgi:glycolate oxidase